MLAVPLERSGARMAFATALPMRVSLTANAWLIGALKAAVVSVVSTLAMMSPDAAAGPRPTA